jgi:hypothetical protein
MALESAIGDTAAVLGPEFLGADAVMLSPMQGLDVSVGRTLPVGEGRDLLAALARGVERGALHSDQARPGALLGGIRRVERALSNGSLLTATTWSAESDSLVDVVKKSLVKGKRARLDSLTLSRRKDKVKMERDLLSDKLRCPSGTVCVKRTRAVQATFYGRIDLSADLRLGARTSFHDAALALELSKYGPSASLVLPVAEWLGLESWVPFEAHLELSLGGISAGPRYVPPNPLLYAPSL